MELDYYEIGQKIRRYREDLGLSQETAAELCGLSPSFYSNIEKGGKVMSLKTVLHHLPCVFHQPGLSAV